MKRRPHRRDEILAAATGLFHEKGYHATGMDDIGLAAGITGPAIYRHFKNKEEILETLVSDTIGQVAERVTEAVSDADTPAAALQTLIQQYVAAALDNPALTGILMFERRILRAEVRSTVERAERHYVEDWVHVLCQVRPELSDSEARVIVQGLIGIGLSAATYRSGLEREVLEPLLISMMTRASLADGPKEPVRSSSRRGTGAA